MSIAGGSTEIRAIRAALSLKDAKVTFYWESQGGRTMLDFQKDPNGYEVHVAPLGMGAWHLTATSKAPEFLPCMDEEAVWQNLQRRTTTPLDRRWMAALTETLLKKDMLEAATSHGRMNPGLLYVDDKALDGIVSAGLKHGQFKIVA